MIRRWNARSPRGVFLAVAQAKEVDGADVGIRFRFHAARGDRLAVGRDRQGMNRAQRRRNRLAFGAGVGVPDDDLAIAGGARERLAVAGERQGMHGSGVLLERVFWRAGRDVPEDDGFVGTADASI